MKTLIVEDSASSLEILCHYVERMGLTPLPAATGTAAVELFVEQRPGLVLLDIILPDIDGFEVARQIRACEQGADWTPIIFLTALTSDKDLEKGIAAGGDDYLYKPVSQVVLAAKVRAMQRIVQMRHSLLSLTQKLNTANRELKRLSAVDSLTGLANRRQFDLVFEREWRRTQRQHAEFSVIICDIDFFKQYNDTYGHQQGDDCLHRVAQALAGSLSRGGDLIARYGGEEFVAVLPETSAGGALFLAEKMREAIARLKIPHSQSPYEQITVSFGIASALPAEGMEPYRLLGLADTALYRAKQEGRNRVCRSMPDTNPPSVKPD